MNYRMSKRATKFPRSLTWEWAKNRYHYCLPVSPAYDNSNLTSRAGRVQLEKGFPNPVQSALCIWVQFTSATISTGKRRVVNGFKRRTQWSMGLMRVCLAPILFTFPWPFCCSFAVEIRSGKSLYFSTLLAVKWPSVNLYASVCSFVQKHNSILLDRNILKEDILGPFHCLHNKTVNAAVERVGW